MKKCGGFSLIELLVVLLIIGLGISMLNINIGGSSGFQLRSEAKQFANNTALMAEDAVLGNQQWGVDIYRQYLTDEKSESSSDERFGYRWLVRNEDGIWLKANDSIRKNDFLFSAEIGLRLELEGYEREQDIELKQDIIDTSKKLLPTQNNTNVIETDPIIPELWLLSSGEMTAFTLLLFHKSNPGLEVKIEGDVLGRVSIADEDEQ